MYGSGLGAGGGGKPYPIVVGSDHPAVFAACRASDEYHKLAEAFGLEVWAAPLAELARTDTHRPLF
eukprot:SAG11_NODE_7954_length_1078_cov_0.822268_2_plen_66_part_00